MSHELGPVKRREFRLELAEPRRIVPEWTRRRWSVAPLGGGLIRFYREIAGVGLVFPRADRPIAVEFPGYPVVRFRPILLELAGRGVACPPQKAGPPLYPPLIGDPKSYPPRGPPLEL